MGLVLGLDLLVDMGLIGRICIMVKATFWDKFCIGCAVSMGLEVGLSFLKGLKIDGSWVSHGDRFIIRTRFSVSISIQKG